MDDIKYSIRALLQDEDQCPEQFADTLRSNFGGNNARVKSCLIKVIEEEREAITEKLMKCERIDPTIYNKVITIYDCYRSLP